MYRALLTCGILFSSSMAFSQRGMLDNAIGLRFGLGSGLTYQHFISDHNVVEVIAMQRYGGISLTGLYEVHTQAFRVRGFKWYMGAGGHAALYGKQSVLHDGRPDNTLTVLGLDGIVGLEYFMRSIPIQISVDWKPALNLYGTKVQDLDNGGISLRYRF